MNDSSIGNSVPGDADMQPRDSRDSLFVLARIRPEGGDAFEGVRVRNVSSGGLMAQAPHGYAPGMRVEVELEGVGTVGGMVAWSEAGRIGVAFDHPVDKARARKPAIAMKHEGDIFRPVGDHRRPPLRTR